MQVDNKIDYFTTLRAANIYDDRVAFLIVNPLIFYCRALPEDRALRGEQGSWIACSAPQSGR